MFVACSNTKGTHIQNSISQTSDNSRTDSTALIEDKAPKESYEESIEKIFSNYYISAYGKKLRNLKINYLGELNHGPDNAIGRIVHYEIQFDVYVNNVKEEHHFKNWWVNVDSCQYYYLSDFTKKYKPGEEYHGMMTSVGDIWHNSSENESIYKVINIIKSK